MYECMYECMQRRKGRRRWYAFHGLLLHPRSRRITLPGSGRGVYVCVCMDYLNSPPCSVFEEQRYMFVEICCFFCQIRGFQLWWEICGPYPNRALFSPHRSQPPKGWLCSQLCSHPAWNRRSNFPKSKRMSQEMEVLTLWSLFFWVNMGQSFIRCAGISS